MRIIGLILKEFFFQTLDSVRAVSENTLLFCVADALDQICKLFSRYDSLSFAQILSEVRLASLMRCGILLIVKDTSIEKRGITLYKSDHITDFGAIKFTFTLFQHSGHKFLDFPDDCSLVTFFELLVED